MDRSRRRKTKPCKVTGLVRPGTGVLVNSHERMAKKNAPVRRSAAAAGTEGHKGVVKAPVDWRRTRRSFGETVRCRFCGGSMFSKALRMARTEGRNLEPSSM